MTTEGKFTESNDGQWVNKRLSSSLRFHRGGSVLLMTEHGPHLCCYTLQGLCDTHHTGHRRPSFMDTTTPTPSAEPGFPCSHLGRSRTVQVQADGCQQSLPCPGEAGSEPFCWQGTCVWNPHSYWFYSNICILFF